MTDDMQEKAAALTGRVCAEFLQHGELNVSAMNAAIETALREAHAAGIKKAQEALAILNECEAQPVAADTRALAKRLCGAREHFTDKNGLVSIGPLLSDEQFLDLCERLIERFAQSREAAALANSERTLPEMLEGWRILILCERHGGPVDWEVILKYNDGSEVSAVGPTPRAAVLAAIALIPLTKTGDAK